MKEKKKTEREKRIWMGPAPQEMFLKPGNPSLAGRSAWRGSFRPQRRAQQLCNRQNRSDLHRPAVKYCPQLCSQPEMLIYIIWATGRSVPRRETGAAQGLPGRWSVAAEVYVELSLGP